MATVIASPIAEAKTTLLNQEFKNKFSMAAQKGLNPSEMLNAQLGLQPYILKLMHDVTGSETKLPQVFAAEKQLKESTPSLLWGVLKLLRQACTQINQSKTNASDVLDKLETNLGTLKQLAA